MNFLTKFPIGQYVDGNKSWLKIIDARLKLILLTIFLISPVWAGPVWRVSLVLFLIFITFISLLPFRVWWRSFVLLTFLSLLVGILSILATSNISIIEIPYRDPIELNIILENRINWNLFEIPQIQIGILNLGPLSVSRRSFELGIKTATLIFTVVHSVNLILLTTLKEELVWSLGWFLSPLKRVKLPIDKWLFQLLIALRFIPLVQEELQNILKSISVRSINYRNLGFKNSLKILLGIIERLFLNIFLRIDQGADALLAKESFEIKTIRFKPIEKKNKLRIVLNSLSLIFIFVAIFLRRMYGSI